VVIYPCLSLRGCFTEFPLHNQVFSTPENISAHYHNVLLLMTSGIVVASDNVNSTVTSHHIPFPDKLANRWTMRAFTIFKFKTTN
jgi:hypothetical protein